MRDRKFSKQATSLTSPRKSIPTPFPAPSKRPGGFRSDSESTQNVAALASHIPSMIDPLRNKLSFRCVVF